ncbi:MAG: 4-phosphopantetheinyl transferase family protein, partial [Bacteroidetes bacterium]|nr:4-phosphopantetheinyl transferase family protein [Bacteroidota bacterium]
MFIGNDIVSIKHAVENKHFLTQRYLNKLFTPKEQRYICSSNMLAYAAWLIWTAKESAYKIYNKQSGKRMYYPKKFEVTVSDNQLVPYIRSLKTNNTKEMQALTSSGVLLSGRVRTPLKNVFVSFFPTHDFIHTLAAENNAHLKNIRWGIASISSIKYKSQSSQVHHRKCDMRVGRNVLESLFADDLGNEPRGQAAVWPLGCQHIPRKGLAFSDATSRADRRALLIEHLQLARQDFSAISESL